MRFHGGPLDGRELKQLAEMPVGQVISIQVGNALLDGFEQLQTRGYIDNATGHKMAAENATSMAQYEIRLCNGEKEAHFVGAVPPTPT
jgi:hypothetical protein